MATFSSIGVQKEYVISLKEMGINKPTEIQEVVIPMLLKNKTDLIGLAQTGTGKTAAFGLPILHKIDPASPTIQALVLAPTRELVQQIQKQLFKFTKHLPEKIFSEGVYGGEKIDIQIRKLQRPTHIVVATPGRLIDLMQRKKIDIRNISTLVLDEADEMLSMGFKQDLNKILEYTGATKNTWLFSATMSKDIKSIVSNYMSKDAPLIEVNKNSLVNANISHHYVTTSLADKTETLIQYLDSLDSERGIIFCRTKAGTRNLTTVLKDEGYSVEGLEGDMQQKERDKVMRAFKKGNLQILISTDVSARGIDVNNLGFVIHYQLPDQIEYYTHRSGRTARAGKEGNSVALVLPSELQEIHKIQKELGIKIKELIL